jgi:hypothetical protein
MKITQTENQLEIKTSGIPSLLIGILLFIIGIVVLVTVSTGIWKINGNGQSTAVIGPIIGVLMAVGGVAGAFLARNRNTILQKDGTSTVTQKHIILGREKVVSFDTKRIQAVCLTTEFRNGNGNGNSGMQRRSQLSLMLDDNSLIQIARSAGSSSSSINGLNVTSLVMKAPLSEQADEISKFLGIPLQSSGDVRKLGGVINAVVEAAQNTADEKQVLNEQPPINAQTPTVPVQQPTAPVEPTVPPENTNWQS